MDLALSFFLRLTLGHLIGDFLLQPFWLVLAKKRGWLGLSIHVGVVTFFTAILVWNTIPLWWAWMIVLYIGHLFIDQFRTFIITDNSRGKGMLWLILDQIAHIILLVIIAWAAIGWPFDNTGQLIAENEHYQLLLYLMGIATLIGMVPVLEVEITVAVWAAQGTEMKQIVAITPTDRVLGGMERVAAMFLVASGWWLIAPLTFLPRLALMIRAGDYKKNRTAVITKVLTSLLSALLIGWCLQSLPVPPFFSP